MSMTEVQQHRRPAGTFCSLHEAAAMNSHCESVTCIRQTEHLLCIGPVPVFAVVPAAAAAAAADYDECLAKT